MYICLSIFFLHPGALLSSQIDTHDSVPLSNMFVVLFLKNLIARARHPVVQPEEDLAMLLTD